MDSTLTFLGRESGFGNSNNSAYTIIDNNFILIDCGFTVFNILKNKFDFSNFDTINVIITHLHNDHAGSLCQFILYIWFTYHKKVSIFSACKQIGTYLTITGAPLEAYELESSPKIQFIPTEHVKHIDSYGFKLYLKNTSIVYTRGYKYFNPIFTIFR